MVASNQAEPSEIRMYADGEWFHGEGDELVKALSPATGEVLGTYNNGTRGDVQRAIDAANRAQPKLAAMTAFGRAELLSEVADTISAHKDELVEITSKDQGKPIAEAEAEADVLIMAFNEAGEHAKRATTTVYQSMHPAKENKTLRRPHGVYGVITPWNVPLQSAGEYIAHGLAVGNTVVWSSASTTTALSAKLMQIIDQAGLPDGAVNFVTGKGSVVGDELVVNDDVDAIAFTGSPETGREIVSKAGLKPTTMELGGNGPLVVMDDANIETATEATIQNCFVNAGQICTGAERLIVHESIYNEFVESVKTAAEEMTLGDPLDEDTDMGPMNNEPGVQKVDRHVSQAVDAGAELLTGGERAPDHSTELFYEPTLIRDVDPDMTVNTDETFGPVAPAVPVSDREEALSLANDINYGLSMGVFTESIETMNYFIDNMESGMINVNDGPSYWEPHTPLGGYSGTESGMGRYGGMASIEEMSQVVTVTTSSGNRDVF